MARDKKYLEIDVKTAAIQRIRHIADTHDNVAVCFSGGKDSLSVLHLVKQVMDERGIKHVNVIFRDEELIPDSVIAFVRSYQAKPWVKMLYFAVPLKSHKFILGKCYDYVQWDPNRPHVRPISDNAILQKPGENKVYDQYSMDEFAATFFKGKVAFLTGIRADESIIRFRASVNKLNENYINASSSPRVSLCKPIYDWTENDVFYYFYEAGIPYCPIYDAQHAAMEAMRVSTPIHAEAAKHHLTKLRTTYPEFYQRVLNVFPEMAVQERYWSQFDRERMKLEYGKSLEGVKNYVLEHIDDPHQQQLALHRLQEVVTSVKSFPTSYPPAYVLSYMMAGSFKRRCLPYVKGKKK